MDSARLTNRLVCVVDFLHLYLCIFDEGGGQTFSCDLIRMKYLRFGLNRAKMTFFIAPVHFFVPTVFPVASRRIVPLPELVEVPVVLPVASRYVVLFPDSVAVPMVFPVASR